jgi:hypothetical protein
MKYRRVLLRALSDTSLCFATCVIMRADKTSRLIEEYIRMFRRKFAPVDGELLFRP